jgi:hypothetical protein
MNYLIYGINRAAPRLFLGALAAAGLIVAWAFWLRGG